MKIAALCDKETAVGLRFAGVHDLFIPKQETLIHLFQDLTKRTDIGIVLITEHFAQNLGIELKEFRIHKKHPIFVEIPDKKGKLEDHVDIVSHLIKRAVGLDVSKKEAQR
jgi:V/A-type H+-transporting ATPase subunit F